MTPPLRFTHAALLCSTRRHCGWTSCAQAAGKPHIWMKWQRFDRQGDGLIGLFLINTWSKLEAKADFFFFFKAVSEGWGDIHYNVKCNPVPICETVTLCFHAFLFDAAECCCQNFPLLLQLWVSDRWIYPTTGRQMALVNQNFSLDLKRIVIWIYRSPTPAVRFLHFLPKTLRTTLTGAKQYCLELLSTFILHLRVL